MNFLPNIILLLIDSLRYDAIENSLTNDKSAPTPHLKQFSRKNIVFDQAISHGTSTPIAVPPLISSTYTSMYGGPGGLSAHRPTVWSILSAHGYQTAAFFTNPHISKFRGWDRGFDCAKDYLPDEAYKSSFFVRGLNQVAKRFGRPVHFPRFLPAGYVVPGINKWLADAREPFFLWVHLMDMHFPYRTEWFSWSGRSRKGDDVIRKKLVETLSPLSETEATEIKTRYDCAVSYVDEQIGNILHNLEQRRLLENSMVIIVADHGEMFGEHQSWYHHNKFYDELIHVPLLMKLPESMNVPQSQKIKQQVRLVDIVPTILDVANIYPSKASYAPQGRSLLPLITSTNPYDEQPAIVESWHNQSLCVRWKQWKFIAGPDWHIGEGPPESIRETETRLFNLEHDSRENHNCLSEYPELAAEFKALIKQHLDLVEPHRTFRQEKIELDDTMIERLRALGYVE